ncbi:hypothetical protein EVAR_13690_1 [Eumeta japonica]|uniref:Reverse transcriptase domain-containing protein n=1 Tax=Eumeta variegata TaxID=151549 RepID=A0A4C1UCT3_EUMVA|nr:hypothetical protein EVAR_13690_1 [Eumeta japonica]
MVSLDIEGVFDYAWWPALKAQLLAYNCSLNFYGMVRGYLRDREVIVRYAGGESRRRTSKGCIKGYIAGPGPLEPHSGLLTPRTRGTRRIRAVVRG